MKKTAIAAILVFTLAAAAPVWAQLRSDEIPNLSTVKAQIREYYTGGQWEKEVSEIYGNAEKILEENQKNSARYAVTLDIDETVLTSYPYFLREDYAFENWPPQWSDWVLRAKAPAMKPAVKFVNRARELGYRVYFITGRSEAQRSFTERNLEMEGLGNYDGLYMTPYDLQGKGTVFVKSSARRQITEKGTDILLNIGDQHSDLEGGYCIHKIKLPNPVYCIP